MGDPYNAYSIPPSADGSYPPPDQGYQPVDGGYPPVDGGYPPMGGPMQPPMPPPPMSGPPQPPMQSAYPVSAPPPQYPGAMPQQQYPVSAPPQQYYPGMPMQPQLQPQYQQPWQPPQPQGGPGRSTTPWLIGAIAVLVTLCLVGGTVLIMKLSDSGDPTTSPTTTAGPSKDPSKSAGTNATGPGSLAGGGTYKAISDLCAMVNLSVLGDWNGKKISESKDSSSLSIYDRTSCRYMLTAADDTDFSLDVEAKVCPSETQGKSIYKSTVSMNSGQADSSITGVGDEVFTSAEERTSVGKVSDYTLGLRSGNLVLTVEITTYADNFISKDLLKDKTLALTKSVLMAIPRS